MVFCVTVNVFCLSSIVYLPRLVTLNTSLLPHTVSDLPLKKSTLSACLDTPELIYSCFSSKFS